MASLRAPCPPGVCTCERDAVLADPAADARALLLNRQEEQRLLERLEHINELLASQVAVALGEKPRAAGGRDLSDHRFGQVAAGQGTEPGSRAAEPPEKPQGRRIDRPRRERGAGQRGAGRPEESGRER